MATNILLASCDAVSPLSVRPDVALVSLSWILPQLQPGVFEEPDAHLAPTVLLRGGTPLLAA